MLPVVRELAAAGVTVVSIDTMRATVAARRARGRRRPGQRRQRRPAPTRRCSRVVADAGLPYVAHALARPQRRHARAGRSTTMSSTEVLDELRARLDEALDAPASTRTASSSTRGSGSPRTPSTTGRCSPTSTSSSGSAARARRGASRKAFLGRLLADPATGEDRPPDGRDAATAVSSTVIALRRRLVRPGARGPGLARRRQARHTLGHRSGRGTGRDMTAGPGSGDADVLAANVAFYEAVERGDLDALEKLWVDDVAHLRASRAGTDPRPQGGAAVLG